MASNIYLLVALILLLGFILGRGLRKVGVTELLGCLLAGVIIRSVLNFSAPEQFSSIITGITLAFVAYSVGLSFSFPLLKKMGKKIIITLMATTTALFQLLSPLGTQYAIKKAGEAKA